VAVWITHKEREETGGLISFRDDARYFGARAFFVREPDREV
jgi:hypothetical protein